MVTQFEFAEAMGIESGIADELRSGLDRYDMLESALAGTIGFGDSQLNGMARRTESNHSLLEIVFLHEQVVGIEGRDHEDTDASFGQWLTQRGDDSNHRELHRSGNSKATPASLASNRIGNEALRANNRNLVGGAGNREE